MFAIFILLWVICVLLIYANPKTAWAWWGSACLFLNGFGGVAMVFTDNIIPYVTEKNNLEALKVCIILKCIANILQHYFATYAFFGFALYYTNFLDVKLKNFTKYIILVLLSIPCIMMLVIFPQFPQFEPSYAILSAWVVPYSLISNAIIIISLIKEKDLSERYQKILVCIFVSPTTLSLMWTSYLSVAMGYDGIFELNIFIILAQFIIFVVLALKRGILGIRLRVERCNLDETIDTVIGGMSMISHAIKNESAMINICVDTIRKSVIIDSKTNNKLNIIKNSSNNLSDFAQRINKFRIYEMDLKPYDINNMVEKVIAQIMPLTSGKNIKILNLCKENVTLYIDVVHASEVLKNIIMNAIEAIGTNGVIRIETEIINNKVCLSVIDNGVGILPENIEKVLTPFYSTKHGKNNFGLGLSYCYKVMKSHKGDLKISSKVNQGTKMTLQFPIKRTINLINGITAKAE